MLHILLILLKIIGIILLASLALVALLFILPASYKIEGIKNKEQSYLRIHGGWLFHLLHFNMEYSEELKYSLRILGFKIYSDDNDENADDSYETFENDEKYEIDRVIQKCRAAATKVGGTGIRYTVQICGQQAFLFDEENGKWFVEAKS